MTNPPSNPQPAGSLALMGRLSRTYLSKHRFKVLLALLMAALEAATNGLIAHYFQVLLDDVFQPGNQGLLLPFAGIVFLTFIVRGLTGYLHQVTMNAVGQSVVARIQQQLYGHLIRSDLAYIQANASGALMSRLVNDVQQMRVAVVECFAGFIRQGLTIIVLVGVMFSKDWLLACLALAILPAAGVVLARLGNRLRRVARQTQEELGTFSSILGQTFQGARHVKAYGMEAHEEARVGGTIDRLRRLSVKSFRLSASLLPINETFSGIIVTGIILYGGYRISAGTATVGELIAFVGAFMLAYQPMNALSKLNAQLQIGLAAAERVLEVLDTRAAVVDRPGAEPLPRTVAAVTLDAVSFGYGEGKGALHDLSIEVPAGKTAALVGASGAGKTTVLNLIPRFYDVDGGAVRIGGRDVRDLTLDSLRASIALVSQETALFDDTIRANIAYGRPGAAQEEIERAARDAAAHDFIMTLPEGYDTAVGENGLKLSGGQRQRIAIARAMLKDAPILLLDEATSALDSESERAIQEALRRLQQGRTTLVIAHRLSTIVDADRIYVLEAGRVVEAGTHAELVRRGGPYSRFSALQAADAPAAPVQADP